MPLTILIVLVTLLVAVGGYGFVARNTEKINRNLYVMNGLICAAIAGIDVFSFTASATTVKLALGAPWLPITFSLDSLSAFFIAVINLSSCFASLYAIGYGSHEKHSHRILPVFPIFIAAMNFVVLANDAFTFLISWEAMSLFSWILVLAHHERAENRTAAYVYLLMASFGTLCLLISFACLGDSTGDYSFAAMRTVTKTPTAIIIVLFLSILGAGSKAGLTPMHIWLPLAHPAAPSHVSGLMSGVMTKVATYGFIRIVFDLLGPPDYWWGIAPMALGAASIFAGALFATIEDDFKKLLAYSTIENIGVIFVALGLTLAFRANGMYSAAALVFTAALFHIFNHSLFKNALFFGAGSVINGSGERSIERLGGLIKSMPVLTPLFLGACLAISALPPFNGFVSEWLLLQGILLSPALPQWFLKFFVPAAGVTFVLGAALGAGCYIRLFGIAFLGRPRSEGAKAAIDPDIWSLCAIGALVFICLFAGLFPGLFIDAISPVTEQVVGGRMPIQSSIPWLSIAPIESARSSYNGMLISIFILISGLSAYLLIQKLWPRPVRRAPAWDCGYVDPSSLTQYSASSFAQPVRRALGGIVFSVKEHLEMPKPGDAKPARYAVEIQDRAIEYLFRPLSRLVLWSADKIDPFNFLTIQGYLSVVFATLIVLLLLVAI